MEWAWLGAVEVVLATVAGFLYFRGVFRDHPTVAVLFCVAGLGLFTVVDLFREQQGDALISGAMGLFLLVTWYVRGAARR
jgi:hypothetical protein